MTTRRLSAPEQHRVLNDFAGGDGLPARAALGDLDPEQFDPGEARVFAARLKAGDDPRELLLLMSPAFRLSLFPGAPDNAEALATRLAQRWQVLGIEALLQPPQRPKYLIDGMIRKPAVVAVYGAPGDLKTMLALDLAVSVASGQTWLDPLPNVGTGGAYQVTQSPVLWLDMENGEERLRERFGALCRARGVDSAPLHAISLPRPVFDASKAEEADLLTAQIGQLGVGFCVVDNLGTVSGGRDENSSQMVDVMANLRWVAESTGATLFVIHHARKAGTQKGGREGDKLRGHTSIEASLDLALLLERDGDDLTIRSTKTRDDPVKPLVVRWTFERTEFGALKTARFWHLETTAPKVPEDQRIAEELCDMLIGRDEMPCQRDLVHELCDLYGVSRRVALAGIKRAIRAGKVIEGRGTHNRKTYRAADG